jgi:hypothetical protein
MNIRQELTAFHSTRYARDKTTSATKGKVNDHDYSSGRVTSRHGAEYWNWIHELEYQAKYATPERR